MLVTERDLDIGARTLLGEAETNDVPDATAIAWVIRNRAELARWPDTPAEVCLDPKQFSCWNDNDPNRARIMAAKLEENPWFTRCKEIATDVFARGYPPDPTKRATHYFATYLKKWPKWARGKTPCYEPPKVGKYQHLFFNDIDTPPPKSAAEALDQEKPLSESSTMKAGGTLATVGTGTAAKGAADGDYWLIGIGVAVLMLGLFVGWLRLRQRQKGEQ